MLDICICTHNPDRDLLATVLKSLANQTLSKSEYRVWVIDNVSDVAIEMEDLQILTNAGVSCNILFASKLGLIHARSVAIESTDSEWLIFVDDDNELTENYLEFALKIIAEHPEYGCFGGKLLLPKDTKYSRWVHPILPYLGIKDIGDKEISNCVNYWGQWEPPGAGFVVRRSVLNVFQKRLAALPETFILGRQGRSLLSAEDSAIARGAYDLELYCAYQPQLILIHHIKPHRFRFIYLLRLLYGHGQSYVLLEKILGNPTQKLEKTKIISFLIQRGLTRIMDSKSIPHFFCMLAWDFGYLHESM